MDEVKELNEEELTILVDMCQRKLLEQVDEYVSIGKTIKDLEEERACLNFDVDWYRKLIIRQRIIDGVLVGFTTVTVSVLTNLTNGLIIGLGTGMGCIGMRLIDECNPSRQYRLVKSEEEVIGKRIQFYENEADNLLVETSLTCKEGTAYLRMLREKDQ